MSHCAGCCGKYDVPIKGATWVSQYVPCPGCGHDDLQRQLAEGKKELVEGTKAFVALGRQMEAKLAEAQASAVAFRVALAEMKDRLDAVRSEFSLFVAKEYDVVVNERNALRATLTQALELLHEAQDQWGDDYLWKKFGLREAIAKLDAGKEAGG